MRSSLIIATLGLWCGWTVSVHAQEEEARVLIDRAIRAQGGEKTLIGLKAAQTKAKGTVFINEMELSFTAESYMQMPDKLKAVLQLEIQNMNVTVIQVFNGKQGWANIMGQTMDLDEKDIAEFKHGMHVEAVTRLVTLRDKNFKVSPVGEIKVDGTACVGIRVTKQGERDVNLYFDKDKHLLLKAEYRALDPVTKQEVNQEKFFSAYKEFAGGLMMPTRVAVKNDDKKFLQMEVTEFRIVDKHDPSIFARP